MSVYKCPVCNSKLELINKSYKCKNNHSYDLSKKGITHLIKKLDTWERKMPEVQMEFRRRSLKYMEKKVVAKHRFRIMLPLQRHFISYIDMAIALE